MLAQQLSAGHESPDMTFRHYAKAATRHEATKFWAIMPDKAKNVVAFKKGQRELIA
jgi:hypothetical protein